MGLFLLSEQASVAAGHDESGTSSTWTGYLIDVFCARGRKDKENDLGLKHTKKCLQMPACDRSGFALLTDANALLVFDENGNRKVRGLLPRIRQDVNLRAVVLGRKSNDVLQVQKIQLTKR